MSAVGIDWGSGYWIAVELDKGVSVEAFPTILNCWREYGERAERLLVDIPIGLPEAESALAGGLRLCDDGARKQLGSPLSSSVFATPCRDAVYAETYTQASERNEEVLQRGLGSQSWSLVPRIQEVDVFLRDDDLKVRSHTEVRESHPEVCFDRLAGLVDDGVEVTARKTTAEGIEQRKELIGEFEPLLVDRYEETEAQLDSDGTGGAWKHRITSTRLDDVLDAMALALTANRSASELDSLPTGREVPKDKRGLPMEIVCPVDETGPDAPERR